MPCADQVPDDFVLLIGHVNRGEFAGAMETGQLVGITAGGLHLVRSFLGHVGRRDQIA